MCLIHDVYAVNKHKCLQLQVDTTHSTCKLKPLFLIECKYKMQGKTTPQDVELDTINVSHE